MAYDHDHEQLGGAHVNVLHRLLALIAFIAATCVVAPTAAHAAAGGDAVTACSTAKKAGARVTRISWASGKTTTRRNLTVRTELIPGHRTLVSKRPGKRSPVVIGCKAQPGRVLVRTSSRRYAFVLPAVPAASVPAQPLATPEPQPEGGPALSPLPQPAPPAPAAIPAVALPGGTAAAIGDSNTVRNGPFGYEGQRYIPQLAWFHHAATRAGQRVRLTANFAVTGTRSDEMLAEQVPQVLAMSPRPNVVTVMAGTNDVGQYRSAAHVIESLSSAYTQLKAVGIKVIAGTILPSDEWNAPRAAVVTEVNAWIRSQPVEVVDFHAALANPDGTPKAGVLVDGTHISTVGAALMGEALAPTLERMFPPVDLFSSAAPGNLLARGSVTSRPTGVDATVAQGFAAGDRVVAVLELSSDAAADTAVRQIEASLRASGTTASTGIFTDTPGLDGPEVALPTLPRSGVLVSLPLRVPAGANDLALSVTVTGGESAVQVGRVAIVKVG